MTDQNSTSATIDVGNENSNGNTQSSENCAICHELISQNDASFVDLCLHKYCFECLKKWCEIKAECPLCKQKIEKIIHGVTSPQSYKEFYPPQPARPIESDLEFSDFDPASDIFDDTVGSPFNESFTAGDHHFSDSYSDEEVEINSPNMTPNGSEIAIDSDNENSSNGSIASVPSLNSSSASSETSEISATAMSSESSSPQSPASPQSMGSPQSPASPQSMGSPQSPASPQSMGSPQSPASPQSMGSPQSLASPSSISSLSSSMHSFSSSTEMDSPPSSPL